MMPPFGTSSTTSAPRNSGMASASRYYQHFPHGQLDETLIGRDQDIERLINALQSRTRIVFLTGGSNLGKSALAAHVASRLPFEQGVLWHDLRTDHSLERLTASLRDDLLRYSRETADDEVWNALGSHQALIVIDHSEHGNGPFRRGLIPRIERLPLHGGTRFLLIGAREWREISRVSSVERFELSHLEFDAALQLYQRWLQQRRPHFLPNPAECRLIVSEAKHHLAQLQTCHGRY
jgi:hypothetical protein